jgi:hypothetical protein
MKCPSCNGPTRLVITIHRDKPSRPQMRYYDCISPLCGFQFEAMPLVPLPDDETPKPEGDQQTS